MSSWRQLRERATGPNGTANTILRHFRIDSPSVPVDQLVVMMGVSLRFDAALDCSGEVRVVGQDATITVNAAEPPLRQRFTIGHELGHLMLHSVDQPLYRDKTFEGGPRETEANKFAAAILMPLWMVERAVLNPRLDERALATLFEVSERALGIRLEQLAGRPVDWR